MQEKLAAYFALLLYSAGAVGLIWLCVRFLLPWAAPFIAAWLIAALLEKPVRFLVRHKWRRGAAAGLCTMAAACLALWAATALLWQGFEKLSDLAKQLPGLMEAVTLKLGELEGFIQNRMAHSPQSAAMLIEMGSKALLQELASIPEYVSKAAVGFVTRTAQASPDMLIFLVSVIIGSYFISAAFPRVNAFLLAQLPEGFRLRLRGLGDDLKSSFGGAVRAQLILMAMTFFQLLVALWLLGVEGCLELSLLTALVDALPVFGTGAVLLPWAACCLLLGSSRRALGLAVTWVLVSIVRNCAQAKLMGDQIGLEPLASLMSIYVGWRVWGVGGMLSFPIILVTLKQLNDRGIVRLWKSV